MEKTVVVFHEKSRVGAFLVACMGEPDNLKFQAACREAVLAERLLTVDQAKTAKYVVQD